MNKLTLYFTVLALCISSSLSHAASFQGLGDLQGGQFLSYALGVSDGGKVVTGVGSSSSGEEAFRWTPEGGMVGLGNTLAGGFMVHGTKISSDGSVIGGYGTSVNGIKAVRWEGGSGVFVSEITGGGQSDVRAVSADGLALAGYIYSGNGVEAYRWTSAGGMQLLGDLPGGSFLSDAYGVSDGGSVVVGGGNSFQGGVPFRWRNDVGMEPLPNYPTVGFQGAALAVNPDGSVIAGYFISPSGAEAFRWDQSTGAVGLGDLPGGSFQSQAFGVSRNGSIIVGGGTSENGGEAFIWDATHGMRSLRSVLIDDYGLTSELNGWHLNGAAAVSSDGTAIVGDGRNPSGQIEAWMATLPTLRPLIASFTPMSGPTGTEVTITGANFGATPGENIVYFGAVRATVTAASPANLTALVPVGATFAPITVTVGGRTAYSDKPFLVNFPGCDMLSTDSFAARQNFTVGTQPYTFGFGDIDGDGKVDMAVALHNSSTIAFFRNISTTGAIAFSPAGSVNVGGTGNTILYPIFADLDGDGKLDLIAANWGTFKVTVFRNASSIGTFSFDPRTDLAVGIAPYCVAVGDFDHDGRPDIVSVNSGNATVSVIRNVSVTGSLNAASFSARQDFATGPGGGYVGVGDIDGDGFLDIITANGADNTISVIRNNSSINGISFATRVDFSTAESPGWLAIGDLDGDGKTDIVVGGDTSTPANTGVFVHRNQASPGFITPASLEPKSGVLTGAAARFVELVDLNGDSKLDIISTVGGTGKVAILQNLASAGALGASSFATPVLLDLDPAYPFEVRAADLDGDGRPDLLATWDQNTGYATVYRNTCNATQPTGCGTSYDLRGNWSTAANPNGVWTYRAGSQVLPPYSWGDSFPTYQPSWQNQSPGSVPAWILSQVDPVAGLDWRAGDVVVHTQDNNFGSGNGQANVVWTSPANGVVTISGGVWMGRDIGRANVWRLFLRGGQLTGGGISSGDTYDRAHPFTFDLGSGGPGVLQNIQVSTGDELVLEIDRNSTYGDYVGVNLIVTLTEPAPPAIVEISIPPNSQTSESRPAYDQVWHVTAPPYPLDVNSGIGVIVNPVIVGGYHDFSLHLDTTSPYDGSFIPHRESSTVTYRFDQPAIVGGVEIVQHVFGITQVEGFSGNSLNAIASLGAVFGPSGDVMNNFVVQSEAQSQVFGFNNTSTAGSYFQLVVRKTAHTAAFANYRIYPLDQNGNRIPTAAGCGQTTPQITWSSPPAIVYGTPLGSDQLNAVANVAGTLSYLPPVGTLLNAGANQTLSVTFTPLDSANYTTANASVTLDVIRATPVITWQRPSDVVVGTPLGGTQLNATADVPGVFTYDPPAGTVLALGNSQTLTAIFNPGDDVNYSQTTTTVTINVVPAPCSQLTALGPAKVWIGLKNSDDVGIKFDLLVEVYRNGNLFGSGQLNSVSGGSSGFNNAKLNQIPITLSSSVDCCPGDTLSCKIYVRNACAGSGKNSGTARLWYNDATANSRFEATIGGVSQTLNLIDGFSLSSTAGTGPRKTIDVAAGAKCSPFKLIGSWSTTF